MNMHYTSNKGFPEQPLPDPASTIVEKGISETDDPMAVFQTLQDRLRPVHFGACLRRYLFTAMGMEGDYDAIPLREYRQIIITGFRDTVTPLSFHDTDVKLSTQAESWLQDASVSRDTVFLLGFGLKMPVEDVSMFLTEVLQEQDFHAGDPREQIIRFCLQHGRPAGTAIEMIGKYCGIRNESRALLRSRRFVEASNLRSRPSRFKHDAAFEAELMQMLQENAAPQGGRSGMDAFRELYQAARLYAWLAQNPTFEDKQSKGLASFDHSDFEQVLYTGILHIPSGCLQEQDARALHACFTNRRLDRQRISRILAGQIRVSRYDLMTLLFYNIAREADADTSAATRLNTYLKNARRILADCCMEPVSVRNPYETFLLMCLLTPDPVRAFQDVWHSPNPIEA